MNPHDLTTPRGAARSELAETREGPGNLFDDLDAIAVEGWDGPTATDLLRFVRSHIVRPVVVDAGLRGGAASSQRSPQASSPAWCGSTASRWRHGNRDSSPVLWTTLSPRGGPDDRLGGPGRGCTRGWGSSRHRRGTGAHSTRPLRGPRPPGPLGGTGASQPGGRCDRKNARARAAEGHRDIPFSTTPLKQPPQQTMLWPLKGSVRGTSRT